ncbi:MAG: hypothetical protein E6K70_20470, partial [Planctomycetota bacterium]
MSELDLWVDEIADKFEGAWKLGRCPSIAQFLDGTSGAKRAALLAELVRIDSAYREEDGEKRTA